MEHIENEISSARRAINRTKELIESHTQDKVVQIYPINNEKHYVFVTNKGMVYQLLYKRNFFMSFGKIFADKEMVGCGESVNQEMIDYAEENGVHNFLFVYQNGNIYAISVKEFKDYAESHGTIRTTSSGERTFSVPIKLLRRWV
jgi:alpha-tubulin suppressor-like RCC1 family protein